MFSFYKSPLLLHFSQVLLSLIKVEMKKKVMLCVYQAMTFINILFIHRFLYEEKIHEEKFRILWFSWRAPMLRIGIGYERQKKYNFKTQRAMNIFMRERKRKAENSRFHNSFWRRYVRASIHSHTQKGLHVHNQIFYYNVKLSFCRVLSSRKKAPFMRNTITQFSFHSSTPSRVHFP